MKKQNIMHDEMNDEEWRAYSEKYEKIMDKDGAKYTDDDMLVNPGEEITINLPTINGVDEPEEMTHEEENKKQVAELLNESGREQQRREEQNVNPDVPRHHKDASSNEEFSRIQLNEQSKPDNIDSSYINLNSNIANEVNMR